MRECMDFFSFTRYMDDILFVFMEGSQQRGIIEKVKTTFQGVLRERTHSERGDGRNGGEFFGSNYISRRWKDWDEIQHGERTRNGEEIQRF